MKKRRENSNNIQDLPEIDIIDLDQEPLEKLSEFSGNGNTEEEEVAPQTELPETEPADSSPAEALPPDESPAEAPEPAALGQELPPDSDISYLNQDDSWISDDWEVGGEEEEIPPESEAEEESADSEGPGRMKRAYIHIGFVCILVLIISLIGYRIWNYGVEKDLSDYVGKDEEECYDSIMPLIPKDGMEVVDDGVTTIVAFGNAPFADDRDSSDNLAAMIADLSGATVYNCSVAGSYLAALEPTLKAETTPIDAFNFYWLTTLFCLRNNEHVYQQVIDVMGDDIPDGAKEAFDTLTTIDFATVDVITLMYDGSDYLSGHNMYSDQNATDIQQFTGNMEAGIELIQATYPHIRIIVMSPSYAYAVDEDGKYVSSDMYRYNNQDVLSTYVIKQYGSAYTRSVTFLDHLYGTITEANADQYLIDNIHLNAAGRKLVAQRFVDALNAYTN